MARYDYVLLDADNTLFDFDKAELHALSEVLRQRGFEPEPLRIGRYHEINRALWARYDKGEVAQDWLLEERFRLFLAELGSDGDAAETNRDYLQALGRCGFLLPGAQALCEALAQRCTLAIVTNGASVAQRGRMEPSPLRPLLAGLFISGEMGCQKPQREYFDLVCRTLGIEDRSRAVMVGDNLGTDILGGNLAGMDTIWYNPGHLSGNGRGQPTWTVDRLEEIGAIILDGERQQE